MFSYKIERSFKEERNNPVAGITPGRLVAVKITDAGETIYREFLITAEQLAAPGAKLSDLIEAAARDEHARWRDKVEAKDGATPATDAGAEELAAQLGGRTTFNGVESHKERGTKPKGGREEEPRAKPKP
jgi:hypothetical protein